MKVLITGASGFVGAHAIHELSRAGHQIISFANEPLPAHPDVESHTLIDLCNTEEVSTYIKAHKPEACLHLAGISFVPRGWSDPGLVMSVNVGGTLNLMEAFRAHAPDARILVVTSAHVYGGGSRDEAIHEDHAAWPDSIYGVSKLAADLSTLSYASHYGMHAMTARPHNHIGPGQAHDFVIPSFASQLKSIADGKQAPVMHVGNLESVCDFADVRDVVRAYRQILEIGVSGRAYNISASNPRTIQYMLDTLCEIAEVSPAIEIDQDRYRPATHWPALDTSRIREDCSWQPEIRLEDSLRDVYAAL